MKNTVSVSDCRHPRYTHVTRYPGPDGKRLAKYFTSLTDAETFAKKQRKETGEVGTAFGSISQDEQHALAFWRDFASACNPAPPSLLDVLRQAKTHWEISKASLTVADAVDKFLHHQDANGAGKRHYASLKSRLGRLSADHGKDLVSSITPGVFADWLNQLRATRADKTGEKLTTTTRINLSKTLRTFFSFAVERGWTLTNPVPVAKRSKSKAVKLATHRAPAILLPADVSRFMQAVRVKAPALVPFWALKFFAGIRDAEAATMHWKMIDMKGGEIHLPASISKTGESRTMKIEPNLAAWLKLTPNPQGLVVQGPTTRKRGFKKVMAHLAMQDDAAEVAEPFVFPSNAARHCFGTFHLYHFRNAGETALQLGHKSNPAMLHEHYKNPAAEKHAGDFWLIYPDGKPRKRKAANVVPMGAAPAAVVRRKKASQG